MGRGSAMAVKNEGDIVRPANAAALKRIASCGPVKIQNRRRRRRILEAAIILGLLGGAYSAIGAIQSWPCRDAPLCPTVQPSKEEPFWRKVEADPISAFTLGLLAVAAIQAGLFVWQLYYMRKGVGDAAVSATAARDAALAGVKSNEISRETFESSERAFVFIDGFDIELTSRADALEPASIERRALEGRDPRLQITRFAAQPKWKNGGNTPTRNMRFRTNWTHSPGPLPSQNFDDYGTQPSPFFIAPRAIEPSEFVDMSAAPQVLVDYQLRPIGNEPLVIIWGRADYEDVFGRAHFIEWCYRLRLEQHDGKNMRAHFIQWGLYNRTDDDGWRGRLGRVDGFDQDQAAYEGEEGSEVFGGLLAAQGDAFEALDFADGLFCGFRRSRPGVTG